MAILLGKNGSVATDVLGPYDVLADSGAFDVYTVSVTSAPVALSGGLTVVPDYSVEDAPTPRIVVVPGFTDPAGADEKPLRDLVERTHAAGDLVVSVCAGARVLAVTDVLDGKRATSFWSDIPGLRSEHPGTTWLDGVRYVRDGDVMTTAGVSSGIVGALDLVRQFAGEAEERRIGARVAYPGWEDPAIPVRHVAAADYPYALNATLPWGRPTYGLGLADGVDEIDVAAAADLYGGVAFTARVLPISEKSEISTRHGLRLRTTPIARAPKLDRLIDEQTTLEAGRTPIFRPGHGFDPILRDIARTDGRAVAVTAAKYIEYPMPPGVGGKTYVPWRLLILMVSTAAVASLPWLVRRRS